MWFLGGISWDELPVPCPLGGALIDFSILCHLALREAGVGVGRGEDCRVAYAHWLFTEPAPVDGGTDY